jgi:hypothetical protein
VADSGTGSAEQRRRKEQREVDTPGTSSVSHEGAVLRVVWVEPANALAVWQE